MHFFAILFVFSVFVSHAQQNLFNIPSGDITKKNGWFYQHQLNFYDINQFESKSHFVYGLGKGWDAGMNVVDLPLRLGNGHLLSFNDNSRRKPLYPIVMGTLQKQFQVTSTVQWNLGSQAGFNVSETIDNKRFAYFNYTLLRWKPKSNKGYLIAGAYITNDVFVGGPPQMQPGWIFGYEYKLTDRWLLMGDFISGKHKKSQTVIGCGYNLTKRVQIFTGALLDFPNEALQDGVVIEINIYGWDFAEGY
ncbi:MAG: hypothetical protein KatS3mg032_0865 [Cyclobacteriaceae bacterium]|nr:MAG: hypothetical protein KatS3mg032_0865 [Cyclobacteriaceae bacterium]